MRGLWLGIALATGFGSAQAVAQTPWTAPRLANGKPDLQGTWENNSATPLERPPQLAGKPLLTEDELAALKARAARLFGAEADAVFGSRMMERFGALRGGMPLYKYVGNKILTTVQNQLLDSKLSEFHSGYRVYSVPFLKRLQFKLNSNDFHFDSEIIIQFLNAGGRIRELPIPTYYGDEICRVNGMKYAKDVLLAVVKNTAHRSGLLYQRRFDPHTTDNAHYSLKLGYPSSHSYALAAVPSGARVLDIGAGPGGVARELDKKGCEVTVVDQYPAIAPDHVEVIAQNLDDPPRFDPKRYDYLLMLDIIEHLRDPEQFFDQVRAKLDYKPRTLILTTPTSPSSRSGSCCCSASSTTARPASWTATTRACSTCARSSTCCATPASRSRTSAVCRRRSPRCWATGRSAARRWPSTWR